MESANSQLALHSEAADIALDSAAGVAGLKVPAKLSLPPNLFIIGTVNVDETTYMFSPKVLDRANVIEFRASVADMGAFLDDPADINLAALQAQGAAFAHAFVQRAVAGADIATLVDAAGNAQGPQLKVDLLEVFGALSNIGAGVWFSHGQRNCAVYGDSPRAVRPCLGLQRRAGCAGAAKTHAQAARLGAQTQWCA